VKIVATYANRKSDPDVVELVDAWDEYSVESNYAGWEESRQKALDSWGDDLFRWVTVEIAVPMGEIYKVLCADEIQVDVSNQPVIIGGSA